MFCLRLLLFAAFVPLAALGGESDESQTWPSPGQRFTMERRPADDLGLSTGTGEPFPKMQLATYVLRDRQTVLWSGVSWTDTSSHSFRCLWLADSSAALILDRPCRGCVEACLVRTIAPAGGIVLRMEEWVEKAVASLNEDANERSKHLTKAWFGEWRAQETGFEGILIVAHTDYHRVHLVLDVQDEKPALRLKAPIKSVTAWDVALEKL